MKTGKGSAILNLAGKIAKGKRLSQSQDGHQRVRVFCTSPNIQLKNSTDTHCVVIRWVENYISHVSLVLNRWKRIVCFG